MVALAPCLLDYTSVRRGVNPRSGVAECIEVNLQYLHADNIFREVDHFARGRRRRLQWRNVGVPYDKGLPAYDLPENLPPQRLRSIFLFVPFGSKFSIRSGDAGAYGSFLCGETPEPFQDIGHLQYES